MNSNLPLHLEILLYCISFSVLPLILPIGVILIILRQTIDFILKIKHKEHYAGLLSSGDCPWVIEDNTKTIATAVFLIKYKKPDQNFCVEMKRRVVHRLFNHPFLVKLNSTKHVYFGYAYLLKNQVTINDCIKTIHEHVNDEVTFRDFLSDLSNADLPKSHAALFDCYVAKGPVQWKQESLFPVVFRFSHIVGDGAAIMAMIRQILLADTPTDGINPVMNLKCRKPRLFDNVYKFLNNVSMLFKTVVVGPVRYADLMYLRKDDVNKLHQNSSDGKKLMAWCNDDNGELFELCKTVRSIRRDIRMSDMIYTAIAASVRAYFKRHNFEIPDYMGTLTPIMPITHNPNIKWELKNTMIFTAFDMAINVTPFSLLGLLEETRRHTEHMRKLPDREICDWMLNVLFGIFPLPLINVIADLTKHSMAISNLPCPEEIDTLNGCIVEDICLYPPNRKNTGVTFLISSYKNRFQFSLIVDKLLITSTEEVQILVDDVNRNLKSLCDEILKEHKSCKKSL